jgi:4a-hydroxytetrahydrobiopterin dehydratase
MDLVNRKCVPCEGGVPALDAGRVDELLPEVPGWRAAEDRRSLHRKFRFPDFRRTMAFVGRMADVAEAEGHHPDFCVRYNILDVTLSTHSVGGLSDNDFILAAKLSRLTPDAK